MEDKNNPLPDQENPEEEYSFLQEVIKDEPGSKRWWKKKMPRLAGCGFVIGIAACIAFAAFYPWAEKLFQNEPEEITIPRDEETKEQEAKAEEETEKETPEDSYRQMLQSLRAVAQDAGKSMVEIHEAVSGGDWESDAEARKRSVSGVIVADNGRELLILGQIFTAKSGEKLEASFVDGAGCEVTVKSQDKSLGLCIYAVDRGLVSDSTWSKIRTAALGSSYTVSMGDAAIVLGKPSGYSKAVGYGIIASDQRDIDIPDGQNSVLYTDIAGDELGSGVIVNLKGEVIGIVDPATSEEDSGQVSGYGISDIKDVIEFLSNGEGVPYAGIFGTDINEEMEAQGMPEGIYVKDVETGSPAMEAGIQRGDIITYIGDEKITNMSVYRTTLLGQKEGTKILVKGCRQGTGGEYVDIEFDMTVGTNK